MSNVVIARDSECHCVRSALDIYSGAVLYEDNIGICVTKCYNIFANDKGGFDYEGSKIYCNVIDSFCIVRVFIKR